ncbi:MAG: aminomethyl-transferring glycine dehydrogenase subunit GcvPA [Erysipelotrichaceae bacterium]|jgi:glycine dehydrogenase subunit 1
MASYVVNTKKQQQEMLKELKINTIDDLFSDVPESVRLKSLNIPQGKSELEVYDEISEIAGKNIVFKHIFRGAGAYNHYIPSIVNAVVSKEEFLTAYTPYQPEISQGILQSIFEYQTQMCELTGLDVSNASVYDGAVAAAEAVFMVQERKRSDIIVAGTVNPQVLAVIKTYCESRNVNVIVLKSDDYSVDFKDLKDKLHDSIAGVLVQSPNYYGIIEDVKTISELTHNHGGKVIMHTNPLALALLKNAKELDVDICTAEGQPLGMPLSFGGPYLGIMTCKKELMRRLPGRIVGQTVDTGNRRCFVLTLQAREQHIRREKASSNICSNQALCAMRASVYCAALGPDGLKQVAVNSAGNAHYLAKQLAAVDGFNLKTDKEFFNEFLMSCPIDNNELTSLLAARGILAGLPVEADILWCTTELNTKKEIDMLVETIKEVL